MSSPSHHPRERRPVIGVMGSGTEEHAPLAEPLGVWIAQSGFHLLTGGGRGVMTAAARAFQSVPRRRGIVLGVVPVAAGDRAFEAPPGYPNPWVDVAIRTHLPLVGRRGADELSRNHINVLSCNVVIALPGGAGTGSEVDLALRYGRPVMAFVGANDVVPSPPRKRVPVARDIEDVKRFVLGNI